MSYLYSSPVKTLGLFERRFEGDDSLLELARSRFLDAGMGAEMHAGTPESLEQLLNHRPSTEAPVVVHLPREFDLVDPQSQKSIIALASRFAGKIHGMVLHDHAAMASRQNDYVAASWKLENELERFGGCPTLFIEYAAGLDPRDFARFFRSILDLDHISACIDISHVGIQAARVRFSRANRGEDVCSLRSQGPGLAPRILEVQAAVAAGADAVLELIEMIALLKKPVHFHLHDGHPLSTFSQFGVADHLSFFTEIPLSFEHNGRRAVPPMFGPTGLTELVDRAIKLIMPRRVSFTLEIHPTGERLVLEEALALFKRWSDKTNAEKMNHWLDVLTRNHRLLREAVDAALTSNSPRLSPAEPAEQVGLGPCDI